MHKKTIYQELKPYTIYVSMSRPDTFILKERQVFNG